VKIKTSQQERNVKIKIYEHTRKTLVILHINKRKKKPVKLAFIIA